MVVLCQQKELLRIDKNKEGAMMKKIKKIEVVEQTITSARGCKQGTCNGQ